ncbi:MAG: PQQ-binding-like beta-propeller repeat protein [Sporomusaceae bacterium]|nr:PQQ-binding-like beta-propeller repeat protein [Sporomusaceae bacterium]
MANKKKNWRASLLIIVFLLTLGALGRFSFLEQLKNTAGSQAAPLEATGYTPTFVLDLGDVEARNYQRMGSIEALLDFSPDEKFLAVGTELGEIIAVQKDPPQVSWREKIGIGKITALKFSADGAFLYVGEASPEGSLLCLDAKTGRTLWRYAAAPAIGVDLKRKSLPAIVKIEVREGKVYALAMRYGSRADTGKENYYYSKIFCFDSAGNPIWAFPADYMDAWVNWLSVDEIGGQVVFGTANYAETVRAYTKNIYALNALTGTANWSAEIPPILEAKRTVTRGSPNISADGQMVTALASDGRGFAYDKNGNLLWSRAISTPKLNGSVYLNAVGRDAYVLGNYVVFGTLNTYNSANWQLPTPVEHPSSNNLVVFDRAGNFKSRWQAGGSIEEVSFSYPYAAIAVGRNTKTKDYTVHGLYIYNLELGEITGQIKTDGPAIAAAVCAQGKSVAVVETPLKLDDGKILGKYRLTIAAKI